MATWTRFSETRITILQFISLITIPSFGWDIKLSPGLSQRLSDVCSVVSTCWTKHFPLWTCCNFSNLADVQLMYFIQLATCIICTCKSIKASWETRTKLFGTILSSNQCSCIRHFMILFVPVMPWHRISIDKHPLICISRNFLVCKFYYLLLLWGLCVPALSVLVTYEGRGQERQTPSVEQLMLLSLGVPCMAVETLLKQTITVMITTSRWVI